MITCLNGLKRTIGSTKFKYLLYLLAVKNVRIAVKLNNKRNGRKENFSPGNVRKEKTG